MHGVIERNDGIFVYVYGCLQKVFRDLSDYAKTLIEANTLFRNIIQEMK